MSSEVFVGIRGTLDRFDRLPDGSDSEDAYSVFAARAAALGWSSTTLPGEKRSQLWHMNDAQFSQDPDQLIAWFQVTVDDDQPVSSSLHPLASCAEATVRRFGQLRLDGLEFLVPGSAVNSLAEENLLPLFSSLNWFRATPVANPGVIRLALFASEPLDSVIAKLRALFDTWKVSPFTFEVDSRAVPGEAVDRPLVAPSRQWEDGYQAVFTVTAPEASIDAYGWLGAATHASCVNLMNGPFVIQVLRAPF